MHGVRWQSEERTATPLWILLQWLGLTRWSDETSKAVWRYRFPPQSMGVAFSLAVHALADVGVCVPGKRSLRRKKGVTADRAGSRPTWVGLRLSR
jgi:hypothetical protein